jgi:cytidyltransferase-like protein
MIVDLKDAASIDGLIANCEHIGYEHGGIIGFYSGVWDMSHFGHIWCLRQASEMCDFLVVGVGTDRLVRENKGPGRPVYPEFHRLNIVNSIKYVDACFLMNSEVDYGIMASHIIKERYHGVMFKGEDWDIANVPGYDPKCDYLIPVYKKRGLNVESSLRGNILLIPRPNLKGSSTSTFIQRLKGD